jgi:UDP-GlcNAc:undecaprenyl-phosphate GlcNAc-1-phosphate transferase
VVNGFNLMDNLDGAAGSCALASAVSIAVVALLDDALWLAVPCVALAGAVVPFLRLNLAGPARIFLGDGGSMAIGFLLAGSLMAAPMNGLEGGADFLAACLLVGVPLFDTTLVVLSRLRRGAPVFSGATDHTTHRLNAVMRSPRAVALALALVQAALAGLAISVTRLGAGPTIAAACLAGLFAVATIIAVDGARWTPLSDDS